MMFDDLENLAPSPLNLTVIGGCSLGSTVLFEVCEIQRYTRK